MGRNDPSSWGAGTDGFACIVVNNNWIRLECKDSREVGLAHTYHRCPCSGPNK